MNVSCEAEDRPEEDLAIEQAVRAALDEERILCQEWYYGGRKASCGALDVLLKEHARDLARRWREWDRLVDWPW